MTRRRSAWIRSSIRGRKLLIQNCEQSRPSQDSRPTASNLVQQNLAKVEQPSTAKQLEDSPINSRPQGDPS